MISQQLDLLITNTRGRVKCREHSAFHAVRFAERGRTWHQTQPRRNQRRVSVRAPSPAQTTEAGAPPVVVSMSGPWCRASVDVPFDVTIHELESEIADGPA